MYTPPILRDGQLWVVDAAAAVRVIDAATGALQRQLDALPERPGTIFSPPALADDRIWILGEQGVLQTVDPAGSAVVAGHLSAARAPLTFDGRALYVRTLRGLSRYDGDAP